MHPSVVRQLSLETLTFKYWNIFFPLIYWSVEAKKDNFITREILMTPPNSEERGLCPSSSKSSLPSCQTDPTTPRKAKVIIHMSRKLESPTQSHELRLSHTWYLSRKPREFSCKFFLASVTFYRFNAKNWHLRQILREKVAFFTDITQKIGVFRCKFYSPKILPV